MHSGHGTRLLINEVATCDGFQMESRFIPTEDKIALIDRLGTLGYAKIEATSFTSPKAIPALRDGEEVMNRIARRPGVVYTALVPNLRGAERALDARVDEFNLVMSASETHNLANLRMTREQSFAQLAEVIALARQAAVPVNVSLSCVFGCPMEGEVPAATVLGWIDRFAALGVQGITLCDTTGMAYPTQVADLAASLAALLPASIPLTLHLHNTRGMALANALAAWQAGMRRFDGAVGGLGGCPYAPGASGNASTEELVHMFDCMGVDTGVSLAPLMEVVAALPRLVAREVPSQLLAAGPRLRTHPAPGR